MSKTITKRHPLSVAFDVYAAHDGMGTNYENELAGGIYLKNRIQQAYENGWKDCERFIKAALDGRE